MWWKSFREGKELVKVTQPKRNSAGTKILLFLFPAWKVPHYRARLRGLGILKQKGTQRHDTQILVPASPLSSYVSMLCRCVSHKLGFLIGKMGAKRPTSPGGDGVLLKSRVQEWFMKRNICTVGCCQFQCLDKSTSPCFCVVSFTA